MTKVLDGLEALADVLIVDTFKAVVAAENAMGAAAKIIQHDAQERIGEYQKETGPFPAWEPLADSTEAEKARLGYPVDAPLLRTGEMRDSIVTEHFASEAIVGSKEKVAAYQEFGTETIPPRPFLGPAAFDNKNRIHKLIGNAAVNGMVSSMPIHPSLGYDMDIKEP